MKAIALVLSLFVNLAAQDRYKQLSALPGWAIKPARESMLEVEPSNTDAWILFERTEFAYRGNGEIRKQQYRLVKVISDRATSESVFAIHGLGGDTSIVKKLKGWNIPPAGKVSTVDRDLLVTLSGTASTDEIKGAYLPGVVKGSLVAWESQEEIHHPMGPSDQIALLDRYPKRVWELELASGGWFSGSVAGTKVRIVPRNFEGWFNLPDVHSEGLIQLKNVPAKPVAQPLQVDGWNTEPWIHVSFVNPGESKTSYPVVVTWDDLAKWMHAAYSAHWTPESPVNVAGMSQIDALKAIHQWVLREISYKQVYLSPSRGWIPEGVKEILRRKYGDCKELAYCEGAAIKSLGLAVFPVLARVGESWVEPSGPPSVSAFNHLILGVQLNQTLGLPSEVEAHGQRFLLIDPTSKTTQLGHLPKEYHNQYLMLCSPEGARWIKIPDSAVEHGDITFTWDLSSFEGQVLQGDLKIRECGNAMRLKRAAQLGEGALLRRLREVLPLPFDAQWSIKGRGNVVEPGGDYEIDIRVNRWRAPRLDKGSLDIRPVILSFRLPPLAPTGEARQTPIRLSEPTRIDLKIKLSLSEGWLLQGGSGSESTAFGTIAWEGKTEGKQFLGRLRIERPSVLIPVRKAEPALGWAQQDSTALYRACEAMAVIRVP